MNTFFTFFSNFYISLQRFFNNLISPIANLFLRYTVASVFLSSGLSKWTGFLNFNEEKYDLFLYEFFCPDPVRSGALQLCDPTTMDYVDGSLTVKIIEALAFSAGVMEVTLAVLLIAGFLSRIAALGLFVMTLFIQLAVFPSWDHWANPASWWAAALLMIVTYGPGLLSVDRILGIDGKRL
jgi:putative oxidoreductase